MHRLLLPLLLLGACRDEPTQDLDVHSQAGGCFTLEARQGWLTRDGQRYAFDGKAEDATALTFQAADLGAYLLFDPAKGYVTGQGKGLVRETALQSDMTTFEDGWISDGEWLLEPSEKADRYQLRHRRSQRLMGPEGLVEEAKQAVALTLEPAKGCAAHPELSLDASGAPGQTTFEDGELYGFVDAHMHLLTNYGFGGYMFHGAPFHRLGVQHALPDCDGAHGPEGRRDLFGYVYDQGGNSGDVGSLLPSLLLGELDTPNHATDGYPTFTDWPNVRDRTTHQVTYYRWLERAWLSGLRLTVQHATSNAVNCNITIGEGWAPARYDCEDMTAVDRQIDEAWAMQRYIDAQWGGPGKGFFRIVTTPAEAREVIADGKLAVVLGIETSDLFDCHLTPRPGAPVCDAAWVDAQLAAYHDRGVRVLFPNHKYDNAFTPGDGSNGFIEAGNFLNSGHYTNKVTEDCPDVEPMFDQGEVSFSGLLAPRDAYQSPAPVDFSALPEAPIDAILPHVASLIDGAVDGDHCQNGTLTPVGEHLIARILERGMILEVDHLPRRSYARVLEILHEKDYPAVGTHGRDNNGELYELGGWATVGFGRCHDPDVPGSTLGAFEARVAQREAMGLHPSQGLGFDFNGLAHGPAPRFGPEGCTTPQTNPVTYPFTSMDGAVTFTAPTAGERSFDYNEEGLLHIGLLPEWIEDLRTDAGDEALEPLFRSAEGYVRLWEKAEARGAALSTR